MAESGSTEWGGLAGRHWSQIVDQVVVVGGAFAGRYVIKVQRVAGLPGNDVIGAGSVATDAYSPASVPVLS